MKHIILILSSFLICSDANSQYYSRLDRKAFTFKQEVQYEHSFKYVESDNLKEWQKDSKRTNTREIDILIRDDFESGYVCFKGIDQCMGFDNLLGLYTYDDYYIIHGEYENNSIAVNQVYFEFTYDNKPKRIAVMGFNWRSGLLYTESYIINN